MKYCSKCGTELFDEAVVCTKCGCPVQGSVYYQTQFTPQSTFEKSEGNTTAAKVFMIIGTVLMAIWTFCIGLAWCLLMTLSYCNKVKRGEPIGTGFKVCTLIFVSLIAGILMLCDNNN